MSIIVRIGAVRGIGTSMTSGNEILSSPQDDDSVEIPPPPDEIRHPQPRSYTTCYGLPYQDHNYNAPPPPTPPQSPVPSPIKILNGHVEIEEVVTTTTTSTNTLPVVVPKDDKFDDSVTRCVCQFQHDDGYMICCDKCSVWQHIDCMGIDRNNIPDSFFCELCEPREIDVERARLIQMRKREELADTSATDTDPDEAANHLASLKKKTLTNVKGKVVKPRRVSRAKEKVSPKKILIKKEKRVTKKEKENVGKEWNKKQKMKVTKESIQKSARIVKKRRNTSVSVSSDNMDPWNSLLSPWVDSYEEAKENHYSAGMKDLLSLTKTNGVLSDGLVTEKLLDQLCVVTEVKTNRKGLVAKEQLHQGQAVIEFKGNVMLREHTDTENFMKTFHPFVLFYSKFENIDLCVDASAYGGEARFVRRSCAPNAEIQHVIEKGNIHFVIFAKKDIPQGGEITIPFDYSYKECSFNVECACLKSTCPVSRFCKRTRSSQNKEPKPCIPASTPAPVVASPSPPPVREKKRTRRFSAPERESMRTKTPRLPPKSPVVTPVASPVKQTLESRKAVSLDEPSPVKKEVVEAKLSAFLQKDQKSAISQSSGETQGLSETDEAADGCKKMTREERKMEAIMKAFEKLAKREERRKEALARLETTKKPDGKEEEVPLLPVPIPEEPEEKPKVESPVKTTPVKGKKNKKHAKRRSRNNSAAAIMEVVSADESSNAGSVSGSSAPASADVSSPDVAGFKFHKTKKHLFNEWMSERGTDGKPIPPTVNIAAALAVAKTEPLEVNVDETMFVTCLPSPRNAMEHMPRRNSQSAGSVPQPVTVPQSKSSNEHSIGSAKKRWLRQAMFETGPPSDSGSASPIHGGASPNPNVCLPSPGGSPPADFVTPLKKRRLARESMSQEQPLTPSPSTPSPSVQPAGNNIDSIGSPPPQSDLEELQNKNGIRTLLPTASEDRSELVCPAKRQRRASSHRESTDADSDASETVLAPQVISQKAAEKDSDLAETSISSSEKDNSVCETADSSADSSGIEVDMKDEKTELVTKPVDTTEEADSGEVREVFAGERLGKGDHSDEFHREQNKVDQTRENVVAPCDSQHSESTCESKVTASVKCVSPIREETDMEVTGSQGFEVSQLTDCSTESNVVSVCSKESVCEKEVKISAATNCKISNIFESFADTDCKSLQSSADTDCHTSISNDNICDSASKCDASATASRGDASEDGSTTSLDFPQDESSCSVSSTVNKTEQLPSPPVESESSSVPDSQSESCESSGQVHSSVQQDVVGSNDDAATVSSTSVVDSSQFEDPGVWLEAADLPPESEDDSTNPPLPLEPPPPPPPPEDMDVLPPLPASPPPPPPPDPPTKKKVSLLEYRKRLKSKPAETVSPLHPPSQSRSHHQHSYSSKKMAHTRLLSEGLSLAPLPLFEGTSPIRKGVNISPLKKDKKKKPEVRKPMSLTERLRQEFGLDDTVEEDTSKQETERESDTPPPPPPPPPVGVTSPASRKGISEAEEGQSPEDPPPPPSAPHPSQLKVRPGLLPHPTAPVSGSPGMHPRPATPISAGPGLLPHQAPTAANSGPIPLISMSAYPNIAAGVGPPTRGVSPVPISNGPLHRNYPLLNGKTSAIPQTPSPVQGPVPPPVGQGSNASPAPVPPPAASVFHQNISSNQYVAPASNKATPAAFAASVGVGYSAPVGQHVSTAGSQQSPLPYVAHVQARHEPNIGQKFEYNHGLGTKTIHSSPQSSWNTGSSSHRPPLPHSHMQGTPNKDKSYALSNLPSSTNHY